MTIGVSSDFINFLGAISERQSGIPFAFYQQDLDFLTVLFDRNPKESWSDYIGGRVILPGVSLIRDSYPDVGDDRKTCGIQVYGGIREFVSMKLKLKHQNQYEQFAKRFNRKRETLLILDIWHWIDERFKDDRNDEVYQESIAVIIQGMESQKPRVHVPLILDIGRHIQ